MGSIVKVCREMGIATEKRLNHETERWLISNTFEPRYKRCRSRLNCDQIRTDARVLHHWRHAGFLEQLVNRPALRMHNTDQLMHIVETWDKAMVTQWRSQRGRSQQWQQSRVRRARRNGKPYTVAGEGLTDIWDIFKAWMGRAAEIVLTLCMFAQLDGIFRHHLSRVGPIAHDPWASDHHA